LEISLTTLIGGSKGGRHGSFSHPNYALSRPVKNARFGRKEKGKTGNGWEEKEKGCMEREK